MIQELQKKQLKKVLTILAIAVAIGGFFGYFSKMAIIDLVKGPIPLTAESNLEELEFPFVNEVMCLEVSLSDNIRCKNQIVEILKNNNYNVSVYPAYCIRGMGVELLEDGKYFKVICNENI